MNNQDIIKTVMNTFSVSPPVETIHWGTGITSHNLKISYSALVALREMMKAHAHDDCLGKMFYEYEQHLRFVLWHYHALKPKAMRAIFPQLLLGYYFLEFRSCGTFDATIWFYQYILESQYDTAHEAFSWTEEQIDVINKVMESVFYEAARQEVFDESLYCFRLLFSDATTFIEKVFSLSPPLVVEQIKDFLENDVLSLSWIG